MAPLTSLGRASAGMATHTALASTNHDKESFNFGAMAEPSVLPLMCCGQRQRNAILAWLLLSFDRWRSLVVRGVVQPWELSGMGAPT
jgi:hypothetical protein